MLRTVSILGLALLGSRHAGAATDVLVVDASGSGDFLDLQPAADAAQDGDTLLVKQGQYGPLVLDGKGLSVLGDTGNIVSVIGGIALRNTSTDQVVVLANLRSLGVHRAGAATPHALEVELATGSVRVENCVFKAADGLGFTDTMDFGGDGAHVRNAADVSFADCEFQGGRGGESFAGDGVPQRAGHGVRIEEGSQVAVHGSVSVAGDAREFDLSTCDYGGLQAHGAWVLDSRVYASGSTFTGGLGGSEGLCIVSFPGGDGIRVDGPTAHVDLLDVALAGGPGNSCGSPPGQPLALVNGGTATTIPGTARSFEVPKPVREGAPFSLTYAGLPGDDVVLFLSARPGWTDNIALRHGILLVGFPAAAAFQGSIPSSGVLTKYRTAPGLPSGVEASTLYLQAVFLDPAGERWLSGPSAMVVLDSAY